MSTNLGSKRHWPEDSSCGEDSQGRASGTKLDYYCENAKKEPGEPPSKLKAIKLEDVAPCLDELLSGIEEPVVGLGHICELQKIDSQMDPTYTCYLCHGTFAKSTIVPHIVSMKHRLNYMKEVDPSSFQLIDSLKFKKAGSDTLIAVRAHELETSLGRGRPEVKLEKTKPAPIPCIRKVGKSSHYVDLDAPGTSQESYSPDPPSSPVSETPASGPSIPAPQGIDDIDILRDVKMIPMEMKLQLLNELVNNPRDVTSDSEARVLLHSLRMVGRCWSQYLFRNMTTEDLQRMHDDLMYPNENQSYAEILGFDIE